MLSMRQIFKATKFSQSIATSVTWKASDHTRKCQINWNEGEGSRTFLVQSRRSLSGPRITESESSGRSSRCEPEVLWKSHPGSPHVSRPCTGPEISSSIATSTELYSQHVHEFMRVTIQVKPWSRATTWRKKYLERWRLVANKCCPSSTLMLSDYCELGSRLWPEHTTWMVFQPGRF